MSNNDANHIGPYEPDLQQQRVGQTSHPPPSTINKREEIVHQFTSSNMTPSIITTINNTNPTPLMNQLNNNGNATNNLVKNGRRAANEPYESYIEDSFVGHWEHEDDGYEHQEEFDDESRDGCEQDKSDLQHPSTIEFDFDSFGPESIIYAPMNNNNQRSSNKMTTPTTVRQPPLVEVSREAEKADEINEQNDISATQEQLKQLQQPSGDIDKSTTADDDPRDHGPSDLLHRSRAANLSPSEYLVDLAQVDLKVIEPYKKVISHAGYCHHYDPSAPEPRPGEPAPAVIIFSACYLPDRSRRDYNYVMDHLFLYVLSSLHELIADDYILIYLHNTQPTSNQTSAGGQSSRDGGPAAASDGQTPNNLPTFSWMKRCYQMIDRKLRKNLKILYLVKPTFWLKTIVIMCKPFISTKFSKKLRFIEDMEALRKCMPVDKLILPASAENL